MGIGRITDVHLAHSAAAHVHAVVSAVVHVAVVHAGVVHDFGWASEDVID